MMHLIDKYARAAASTARTPPNSPARWAALDIESAARADAQARVDAAEKERDELRARLAELGRQEPVAWLAPAEASEDWPWPHAFFAADAHPHIRELMDAFPVYARPAPAIDHLELLKSLGPNGWATSPEAHAQARLICAFAETIAAAPEHKA